MKLIILFLIIKKVNFYTHLFQKKQSFFDETASKSDDNPFRLNFFTFLASFPFIIAVKNVKLINKTNDFLWHLYLDIFKRNVLPFSIRLRKKLYNPPPPTQHRVVANYTFSDPMCKQIQTCLHSTDANFIFFINF